MSNGSFCTKCGTKIEGQYCHACGHRSNQLDLEETITSTTQDNMKMYIGDDADYYIKKWNQSSDPQKTMSWNWAAFLISMLWFGYRKMYINLIIFLGILTAININDTSFTKVISYLYVFFVGLFGNAIYYRHVKRNIRIIEALNLSQEELNSKLKKTGGTSLLGVFFSIFVIILYGVVLKHL